MTGCSTHSLRQSSKAITKVMRSQKVVTPAKAGVHGFYNHLKKLDSGFRRNDGK
jgi:hypothetical protein